MELSDIGLANIPSRDNKEPGFMSLYLPASQQTEESENDDETSIADGLDFEIGERVPVSTYAPPASSKMQQLTAEEEKTWTTLDSVHSKASTRFDQVGHASFNNSTESFNSFGGSSGTMDAYDLEELRESQAEFKKLDESPSSRSPLSRSPLSKKLMDSDSSKQGRQLLLASRSASTRMLRGPSFRGSLTLINEDTLD